MSECMRCGGALLEHTKITCYQCNCDYHYVCAGLMLDITYNNNWRCYLCSESTSLSSSVTRQEQVAPSTPSESVHSRTSDEVVLHLSSHVMVTLENLKLDLITMKDDLKRNIAYLSQQMSMIESTVEERTLIINRNLLTIKSLIRRRSQDALEKDIIITNLYESSVENLTHLVYRVAHVLGVYLTFYDILSVERLGRPRYEGASALVLRPRPVAARFSTRRLAEEMVQRGRVLRNLNNEHLDLPGPRRRVVVYERLTRYFEHLYNELRSTGIQQGYKYIWNKRGRLYVRKTDNHPVQQVRSWEDYYQLFPNNLDHESID